MEQLPKEQQEIIKKLNADRLRARLTKLGVEEEVVFAAGGDDVGRADVEADGFC